MFYRDLSEYTYFESPKLLRVYNIGWLDGNFSYQSCGAISELLEAIIPYVLHRVNFTRGRHTCNLHGCNKTKSHILKEYNLGTAEIWVKTLAGTTYACPDLILHYIADHNYTPPVVFQEALFATSQLKLSGA